MSDLFAVDRYLDKITTPEHTKQWNGQDCHHYFKTQKEAHDFIIKRASDAVDAAENKLRLATKRYARCFKKFSTFRLRP